MPFKPGDIVRAPLTGDIALIYEEDNNPLAGLRGIFLDSDSTFCTGSFEIDSSAYHDFERLGNIRGIDNSINDCIENYTITSQKVEEHDGD